MNPGTDFPHTIKLGRIHRQLRVRDAQVRQIDLLRLLDVASTERARVEFVRTHEATHDVTARTEGAVDIAVHAHVARQRILNLPHFLLQ